MDIRLKKIIIILGIFVPVYFFYLITTADVLWPGYNSISEFLSVLGSTTSPLKVIINTSGFMLLGITLALFGFVLSDGIKPNRITKTSTILNIIGGICIFIIGFLPADRLTNHATFIGLTHSFISLIVFLSLPLSIILWAYSNTENHEWKGWIYFSYIISGSVIILTTVVMLNRNGEFAGIIERLGIGIILLWVFLVSIKLYFKNAYENIFPAKNI